MNDVATGRICPTTGRVCDAPELCPRGQLCRLTEGGAPLDPVLVIPAVAANPAPQLCGRCGHLVADPCGPGFLGKCTEPPLPACTCAVCVSERPRTIYDTRTAVDGARDALTRQPVDFEAAQAAVRAMLVALGEDPDREGLQDTPRRVAAMWAEFLDYDPGRLDTAFSAEATDQMVVVSGMRVWSMCEHHLLPFWCDVSIGYLGRTKLLGLSKLGRIAHKHAHQLQLQERLVAGIANELQELLGNDDVAVVATGEHLCMTMRGIGTAHRMTSSSLHGAFLQPAARAEFFSLAAHKP